MWMPCSACRCGHTVSTGRSWPTRMHTSVSTNTTEATLDGPAAADSTREREVRTLRLAVLLCLVVFALKLTAYLITGVMALFAEAVTYDNVGIALAVLVVSMLLAGAPLVSLVRNPARGSDDGQTTVSCSPSSPQADDAEQLRSHVQPAFRGTPWRPRVAALSARVLGRDVYCRARAPASRS